MHCSPEQVDELLEKLEVLKETYCDTDELAVIEIVVSMVQEIFGAK